MERAGALWFVSQNSQGGSPGAGPPVYHPAGLREQFRCALGRRRLHPQIYSLLPREETVSQKTLVTVRTDLFEKRKQEHLQAGYRIENEQPVPVNGLCSFIAVRVVNEDETRG